MMTTGAIPLPGYVNVDGEQIGGVEGLAGVAVGVGMGIRG